MDVTRQYGKIGISIHKDGFVSSLIKMADAPMPTVEIADVSDVEVAHEFGKVPKRRLDKQVKMVGHHNVAVELDGVNVYRLVQDSVT